MTMGASMAKPDSITITVDEEALRAQVAAVIQQATHEGAMRLRFAADSLDPEFWQEREQAQAAHYRAIAEAEVRKTIADQVRRHCTLSEIPNGIDAIVNAVADWIENPPEWVTKR